MLLAKRGKTGSGFPVLAKQGKAGSGFSVLVIACIVWLWFRFGNGAEPLFIMRRIPTRGAVKRSPASSYVRS